MQSTPTPPARHTAAHADAAQSDPPSNISAPRAPDASAPDPGAPAASDQTLADAGGSGDGLDDAARGEREDVRGRLREELGREPTDEEMDEWLRQHTEGY